MTTNTNFATWNGVVKPAYTDFEHGNTKSDGNTGTDAAGANSSIGMSSGKWYAEFYLTVNTTYPVLGLSPGASAGDNRPFNSNSGYLRIVGYKPGATTKLEDNSSIFSPASFGTVTLNQTNVLAGATGDIIGMAVDVDNKKLWLSKNGTFMNSGDPAAGSNEQISWTTNPQDIFFNCITYTGGRAVQGNWGQDSTFAGNTTAGGNTDENGYGDFKYSVPTGFLALCSANLPVSDDIDPAQTDTDFPQKQFNTITYTGANSAQSVTGLGFKPDLVWLKARNSAQHHAIFDSSRGALKRIGSSRNNAEDTFSGFLSSFDTDGFSFGGADNTQNGSYNYVGWCWRANGGTTASDGNGSITTTVQANTASGFSIITYTGTGSNATIGHGLSAKPDFILFKRRSGGGENWQVYHSSLGATKYLLLNHLNASSTSSTRFQDTEPTNSVISIGSESGVNTSSGTHVAYCWHGVDGYSKFGTYEGNGDDENGPFIYTGFRPRLIFCKNIDTSNEWFVQDTARETHNVTKNFMEWNSSDAEQSNDHSEMDILSNGFKCRGNSGRFNDTATYVYGAWGDVPFKYNNTF